VLAKPLGDFDVPTLDRDVHAATLALRTRTPGVPSGLGMSDGS
jgi:hypothetical protein